jgi:hypothetical protein
MLAMLKMKLQTALQSRPLMTKNKRSKTNNSQPSAFSLQPSIFSLQPSTFNLQPSTFNLFPATFNKIKSPAATPRAFDLKSDKILLFFI